MGGEELKRHQLAHHQLMSQQGPQFSPHSRTKKAQISGKLGLIEAWAKKKARVTSGISDVAIASVHSENIRQKKMIMMIIIITSHRKRIY